MLNDEDEVKGDAHDLRELLTEETILIILYSIRRLKA